MSGSKNQIPEQPHWGISGIAGQRVISEAMDEPLEISSVNQPGDEISIHNEKFYPTPNPDKWERRSFGEPAREKECLRKNAEIETDRDLNKPLEQLACDIHETYLRWEQLNEAPTKVSVMKEPVHLVLYALARTASMSAKIALSNDRLGRDISKGIDENIKLQHKIEKLTKWLIGLTWVIAILTGGLFLKEILAAFKIIG